MCVESCTAIFITTAIAVFGTYALVVDFDAVKQAESAKIWVMVVIYDFFFYMPLFAFFWYNVLGYCTRPVAPTEDVPDVPDVEAGVVSLEQTVRSYQTARKEETIEEEYEWGWVLFAIICVVLISGWVFWGSMSGSVAKFSYIRISFEVVNIAIIIAFSTLCCIGFAKCVNSL
jgi:cytochrome b subunit of formate dehydrogenase